MPYFPVSIRLTDAQKREFSDAILNDTRLRMVFMPHQIGQQGTAILVTIKQWNDLALGKASKRPVNLNFNKTQMRLMAQQIGNGILDNIGSFLKGAATKVGKAATKVGKWFSGNKKPPKIELTDFKKQRKMNNVKRHPQAKEAAAFFEEQRELAKKPNPHRFQSSIPPTEQLKLDRLQQRPEPGPLPFRKPHDFSQPDVSSVKSMKPYVHNSQVITKEKMPKMTVKDHAIAQYLMNHKSNRPSESTFRPIENAFDSIHSFFSPDVKSLLK